MTRGWLAIIGLVMGASLVAAAAALAQPATTPETPNTASNATENVQPQPDQNWHGHRWSWGLRHRDPKQICGEHYAREAGFLAYLGAKLDLNAQQQPLWDKYQQAMLTNFAKLRDVCIENKSSPRWNVTALQRRDRMEKMLTAKLDALHATRPALDALYQSLSPEQRNLLDHPRPAHRRH